MGFGEDWLKLCGLVKDTKKYTKIVPKINYKEALRVGINSKPNGVYCSFKLVRRVK